MNWRDWQKGNAYDVRIARQIISGFPCNFRTTVQIKDNRTKVVYNRNGRGRLSYDGEVIWVRLHGQWVTTDQILSFKRIALSI